MTTTKELFASGLNYILRDIADEKETLENGVKYLKLVEQKMTSANREKNIKLLNKIHQELSIIKENIKKHEKEFKFYVKYFGYTEQDLKDLNIHPATDEEIERDYQRDLKEMGYDKEQGKGKYTKEQHDALVQKVQEFNLLNDLPVVSF